MVEETTKACTRCGEVEPQSDYHKHAKKRDGLQGMCKTCFRAYMKRYRENNKAAIAAQKSAARKTPAGRAWQARYRASEKAKIKARAAATAQTQALADKYVKKCLRGHNLEVSATKLPAELVEMKRLQLLTLRLARALKKATHESSKDPR